MQKPKLMVEIEETVILKQGGKITTGHCPLCLEKVEMVSPDILALISDTSEREIFRLIEAGTIFFDESDRVVVCPICYKRSISDALGCPSGS